MNSETITVLIPAYNASTTIARAINSILDQTYDQDKIKILVIDDGSKDSTLSVLQKIQKTLPESKLEIISRENKGLSYTRSELVANVHTK
jgi:glycosyltransferase involved in cell wall biosynthesis